MLGSSAYLIVCLKQFKSIIGSTRRSLSGRFEKVSVSVTLIQINIIEVSAGHKHDLKIDNQV